MVNLSVHSMGKASDTGGVKPMNISGRLISERERLLGMTDAERSFRKQWLKDQELAPNEPRNVPEIYKAMYNPIRRLYRWPLNKFEGALATIVGPDRAFVARSVTSKLLIGIAGVYWMYYYMKYNRNTWERKGGVKLHKSRELVLPGDPRYPYVSERSKGSDYDTRGFEKNTLNL